jgi:hypothetical protein
MPLDLDPNVDRGTAKVLALGGREFLVAPLPLRQVIALGGLLPAMRESIAAIQSNGGALTLELFAPIVDVLVCAFKKAHPTITRDDLLDLPIHVDEMLLAVPAIVAQAGGKPADPGAAAGEASAASPSSAPTGADSSQT